MGRSNGWKRYMAEIVSAAMLVGSLSGAVSLPAYAEDETLILENSESSFCEDGLELSERRLDEADLELPESSLGEDDWELPESSLGEDDLEFPESGSEDFAVESITVMDGFEDLEQMEVLPGQSADNRVPDNAALISLGETKRVTFANGEEWNYFAFVPSETAYYKISSDNMVEDSGMPGLDPQIWLLDEYGEILNYADSGGIKNDFIMENGMTAGKLYYLQLGSWGYPGSYEVRLEKSCFYLDYEEGCYVPFGKDQELAVTIATEPGTEYTCQWYEKHFAEDGVCTLVPIAGETGSRYTVRNVTEERYFRLIVKSGEQTYQADFCVYPDSGFELWYDGSIRAALHEQKTLQVKVHTDAPELTYQWYRQDCFTGETEALTEEVTQPAMGDLLLSRTIEAVQNDCYYCMFSDGVSTGSAWFDITIENHLAAEAVSDTDVKVPLSQDARLSVTAGADDTEGLSYQWLCGGEVISGATNEFYLAEHVTEYKEYTCIIMDKYGNTEQIGFTVAVDSGLGLKGEAHATIHVQPGQSAHLDASAYIHAARGSMTYQWLGDFYQAIEGETGACYTTEPIYGQAEYFCRITDAYGGMIELSFTILADEREPGCVHQPEDWQVIQKPTCTEKGEEVQKCKKCGKTVNSRELSAAGHTFSAWTARTSATVFAAATEKRTCSVCKRMETRTVGAKLKPTVKLSASSILLKEKQKTTKLTVTGLAAGDSVVSWTSSNTKVVKVSGKSKGTCTITAQKLAKKKKTDKATIKITLASGKAVNVKVTVQKTAVKTQKVTVPDLPSRKLNLEVGKTAKLAPVIAPITSLEKVTFKSSNKKVATVSSGGKITAKKSGKAKITVKSGKKSVTITVNVPKLKTTAIKNVPSRRTVNRKRSFTLKPKLNPTKSEEKITYKSSNRKIAVVTSKGKVTGKKAGTAVITVRSGKVSVTCKVTVK